MDETGAYYTEWSKPERKPMDRYVYAVYAYLCVCVYVKNHTYDFMNMEKILKYMHYFNMGCLDRA